jgi:hypothetical protein
VATITWEELIQKGGGNIHYIFTVAGYPWAVTDHPDVVTLLNDGSAAAKTARQTIFGSTLLNSPELLSDGDMEASGTSSWGSADATLSKETASPKRGDQSMRVTATAQAGSQTPRATQVILTIGTTYRITGWARSDGTQTPFFYSGSTHWTGTTGKEWQRIDTEFVAGEAAVRFLFSITDPGGTEWVEFDQVSVKEVTTYLAEDTDKFPIFATLENFSGTKFSLNETRGEIKGGGWSVEIADIDLEQKWSTTGNVGNTDSWGLPGVHAIAQPRSDTAVGFGTLHETCAQSATTLTVYEQDGGTLDSGVPDGELPDSEYRLLWVDQECVAASSVMPNSTELLADGDMEKSGTTDWGSGDATLSKETTSPKEGSRNLKVLATVQAGAQQPRATQAGIFTIGNTYRAQGWVRSDGTQIPKLISSPTTIFTGTSSTSWQRIDAEFTAGEAAIRLLFDVTDPAGTEYVEWDGMTIKEVATSNDITLTARGVARSRDADHFTSFYDNVISPLVIDTPPSIIDKPCTLWAIGLTNDGSSILTSVLSVLERLNTDFQLPKYEGRLARYVFHRGNVGIDFDDTTYGVLFNYEVPHLVIKERTSKLDRTGTNLYIWLCARQTSVEFDSPEEVLQALSDELGKIAETAATAANEEQVSGDATVGRVTTTYKYHIKNGKIYQSDKDGSTSAVLSQMTGPLAWCFNLGFGPNYTSSGEYVYNDRRLAQLIGGINPWFTVVDAESLEGVNGVIKTDMPWLTAGDATNSISDIEQNSFALRPHDDWVCDYFYSYHWNENFKAGLSLDEPIPKTDSFRIPAEEGGTDAYLYMKGEEAASSFIAADELAFGNIADEFSPGNPNYGKITIDTIATDSGYTKIEAIDNKIYKALNSSPFTHGRPLFSMKALDMASSDNNTDSPDPNYDMWSVGYRVETTSPNLSKIFRGILNDPGHGTDLTSINQLTFITGFTTQDDFVSIIDWDDLDKKSIYAKQELNIGDYKLKIAGSINLYEMLKNEVILHGLTPTYEWDQESGQFRIKFRSLAPMNATAANFNGRVIDNSTLVHGLVPESNHNDAWLANNAKFQANYDNGRYYRTYNVTYNSGFAMNRKASRSIRVSSVLSHIGADKQSAENYFSQLLYRFSRPEPILKARLGLNAFLDIALGREVSVTDATARNPYDHTLGLTDKPALITAASYDWIKGVMNVSYRLSDEVLYGWAPACYVTANNSTKDGGNQITCSTELHEFSNITDRVDCMWFDCYYWNPSTSTYTAKTSCGCGNYAILAFERYKKSITLLEFDVTSVSSDGTLILSDVGGGGNYTAWDVTKNYVLIFDHWDNVETCQQKFVYFADDNDTLGTGNDRGMRWG